MKITIETSSYNERRYGKPWIAIVDFSASTKGDFDWGEWAGDHYNGGEGVLEITAAPGDIIARGQKDNRKPKNSAPNFYFVTPRGELENIGDKGAAYRHYLANEDADIDRDALQTEKETLLARIAEINELLE